MRVLAQLHHSEEPIAISSECIVYHRVDCERERATLLPELPMLVIQCLLTLIEFVGLVDANIEHVPLETFR